MKRGVQYIITAGEYSDYGIRDSFIALRDFSFDKALARWLDAHGDKTFGEPRFGYDDGQGDQDFLAWLRSEHLVADAAINSVHLRDYSEPYLNAAGDAADEPGAT